MAITSTTPSQIEKLQTTDMDDHNYGRNECNDSNVNVENDTHQILPHQNAAQLSNAPPPDNMQNILGSTPVPQNGPIHPSRLSTMRDNLDDSAIQKDNPTQYVNHPSRMAVRNENVDPAAVQKESPILQGKDSSIEGSTRTRSTRVSRPGAFRMGEMMRIESLNEAVSNECRTFDTSDSGSTASGSSTGSQLVIVPRASVVGKETGDDEQPTNDGIFNIPVVYAVRNVSTRRRRTLIGCGVLVCVAIAALLGTVIHLLLDDDQALGIPVYITNAPTPVLDQDGSFGSDMITDPIGIGSVSPSSSPTLREHVAYNETQAPSVTPSKTDAKDDIFAFPTQSPTLGDNQYVTSPTRNPTRAPTRGQVLGSAPNSTPNPNQQPTPGPTRQPTPLPTGRPTPNPTRRPTRNPTPNPVPRPTRNPTRNPTPGPTPNPTRRPARQPTPNPTPRPTPNPTPNRRPPPPDGDGAQTQGGGGNNGGGGRRPGGGQGGGGGGGGGGRGG